MIPKSQPGFQAGSSFSGAPAWVQSNGCKSRVRVDRAKDITKGKSVHREVESSPGEWDIEELDPVGDVVFSGTIADGETVTIAEIATGLLHI